jgi:hypothetical protein
MRYPRAAHAAGCRPVALADHRPPAEDVAAHPLQLVQHAQAAGDDQAQLEADAPGQFMHQRTAVPPSCARARSIWKSIMAAQAASQRPSAIWRLRDAEARQLVLRQVDAALLPVDGDVLPVVDELQAAADAVRQRLTFRIVAPYRRNSSRPTGSAERRQ